MMVDVQDFYRTELQRNGYGPKTFRLDCDSTGKAKVHLVTLDWNFDKERQFTPKEIRPVIAETLLKKGIDIQEEYAVIFMNAYWKDGDTLRYDVVYTGSGNPVKGLTWVVDHQLLDSRNFDPALQDRINDRGQRLTTGQFNVKMIGGVAHEFGHALGLPHNRQTREERGALGTALMGSGNYTYRQERLGKRPRGSFITRPHAFAMSLHPLFTRTIPDSFEIPNVFPEDLTFDIKDGMLLVKGRLAPAGEVAGVILYHDPLPTGVNKDYDAFSYLAEMGDDGVFSSSMPLLESSDGCALHIDIYFKNGMHRKISFTRDNAEDGGLATLRTGYLDARTKHAFLAKDAAALEVLVPELKRLIPEKARAADLFLRISKQWETFTTPDKVPATTPNISLSSTKWSDATVGWDIPSFNGIVDPNGRHFMQLHSSEGPRHKGLYAHADSNYTYALGGSWKRLTGRMAIQRGRRKGSVIFAIKGDGTELYRSRLVKLEDGELAFSVDVTDVQELELITECGPDGKEQDWGIWINPVLER